MFKAHLPATLILSTAAFGLLAAPQALGQTEVLVKVVTGEPEKGMASKIIITGAGDFKDFSNTQEEGSVRLLVPACDHTTLFNVHPNEFFYSNEFGQCEADVTKFITKPMSHAAALDAVSQIRVLFLETGPIMIPDGIGGPGEPSLEQVLNDSENRELDTISGLYKFKLNGTEYNLRFFKTNQGAVDNLLLMQKNLEAGNLAWAALYANEVGAHLRNIGDSYLGKAFSFAAMDYGYRALGYNPSSGNRPLLQYDTDQHGYYMTPAGSNALVEFQTRQGITANGQWDHPTFVNLRKQKPRPAANPQAPAMSASEPREARARNSLEATDGAGNTQSNGQTSGGNTDNSGDNTQNDGDTGRDDTGRDGTGPNGTGPTDLTIRDVRPTLNTKTLGVKVTNPVRDLIVE